VRAAPVACGAEHSYGDAVAADPPALRVVIAGGGVAALEGALALRALAGDRVAVTLLSPAEDFVYLPMAVVEPFAGRPPRALALADFALDAGASFEHDGLSKVDCKRRVVHTEGGHELPFDALIVAVGARRRNVVPGAIALDPAHAEESLGAVIEDVDRAAMGTLALVAPEPSWPVPAYELALLMSERARDKGVELEVTVITDESAPCSAFGEEVSAAIAERLEEAGVHVRADAAIAASLAGPDGLDLGFDRVIALPRLEGPAIVGLPTDARGFLPLTPRCEVVGAAGVYAAGDVTDFPVKLGGIAAQHADTAAAAIAAQAGTDVEPSPFRGEVSGMLLGGWEHPRRLYFSARIEAGITRDSRVSDTPLAEPEAKIAARYLGPYLDERWAEGARWVAEHRFWEDAVVRLRARLG
jgi:sulfide:quinone oxidoreductase